MKAKTMKIRKIKAELSKAPMKTYTLHMKTRYLREGDIIIYSNKKKESELVIKVKKITHNGFTSNITTIRRAGDDIIARYLFSTHGDSLVYLPRNIKNFISGEKGYKTLDDILRRVGL